MTLTEWPSCRGLHRATRALRRACHSCVPLLTRAKVAGLQTRMVQDRQGAGSTCRPRKPGAYPGARASRKRQQHGPHSARTPSPPPERAFCSGRRDAPVAMERRNTLVYMLGTGNRELTVHEVISRKPRNFLASWTMRLMWRHEPPSGGLDADGPMLSQSFKSLRSSRTVSAEEGEGFKEKGEGFKKEGDKLKSASVGSNLNARRRRIG